MANRTYRLTEIVGTSTESMEDAVRNGIQRASQTLRHLDWFEVTEVRGQIGFAKDRLRERAVGGRRRQYQHALGIRGRVALCHCPKPCR